MKAVKRIAILVAVYIGIVVAFESLIDDFARGTDDPRRLEARAAGLKAFATWHAVDTIQAAREATGGQGYLAENRLTTMRSDVDIFTTYEGDNTVLTQLVAKALLTDFRQQFDSMGATGMVRYLFHRTASAVTEANPITRSATDSSELLDASWQLDQLRWRESHQVESLALRMRNRINEGSEPFDAFTQVQTHAMTAAASHVDVLVLESFTSAVAGAEEGPTRIALDRLRALHGLATIRADLAWFQEHGHVSASSATAVRKLHDHLVAEIANESLALVDAFGIPDQVLAAPIAARND
jgi:acyl-CoA oxidase